MSSSMTTKRRLVDQSNRSSKYVRYSGTTGEVISTTIHDTSSTGRQITTSEGHPGPYNRFQGRDNGGDFTTRLIRFDSPHKEIHPITRNPSGNILERYDGPLFPFQVPRPDWNDTQWNSTFPDMSSSPLALDALGTKAIALCKPTRSASEVSSLLGELFSEGLPSAIGAPFWKDRTKAARGAGSEYLNYEFGWKPLVSSIQDLAQAMTNSNKILSQFEKDSGKLVRRRFEFPTVFEHVSSTATTNQRGWPAMSLNNMPSSGTWYRDVTLERRRWFEGAFMYHLPTGTSSWARLKFAMAEAEKLFGIEPTPELIWNLAPWSWAADWAFNMGDVMSNVSDAASFGLVMPYGYMMETTIVRYNHTLKGFSLREDPTREVRCSIVDITKKRRAASPFGFGLTWSGLSTGQLGVLAALGITRGGGRQAGLGS